MAGIDTIGHEQVVAEAGDGRVVDAQMRQIVGALPGSRNHRLGIQFDCVRYRSRFSAPFQPVPAGVKFEPKGSLANNDTGEYLPVHKIRHRMTLSNPGQGTQRVPPASQTKQLPFAMNLWMRIQKGSQQRTPGAPHAEDYD